MHEPIDPTILAKYSRLALRAREIVEGMLAGMHHSPFKGFSVEFAEHRQYYPGDEIRHIDWRAFGKTDRYFIKEYEEETNLQAWLVVDASGSMAFAGRGPSKYQVACELGVALAYLLLGQRDAVGLFVHDDKPRFTLPPLNRLNHWLRIAQALEQHSPGGDTSLGPLWRHVADILPRRGLVILLTDAFAPIDDLILALRRLRHARNEVLLLQIVAPEEVEFPFRQAARFRSLENGREVRVDPVRMRASYLEAFERHSAALQTQAASLGVEWARFRTDQPLEEALGGFLTARMART